MILQDIKIEKTENVIHSGIAIISGVNVYFCYNFKTDKFSAICYDVYRASGKFEEAHNQKYLVGRLISKGIKLNNNF